MKFVPRWFFVLLAFGLVLSIAYFPLPVEPYLDFQALYHANLGVLRGIPLYDWAGQVNMIAELAGIPPAQVVLNPFAYPPWYALITLPLALLPIAVAARLWFVLNLLIVIVFVWLATEEWPERRKLISFLLAILFLPVLGALFVGQFIFPVLLGAGLLVYALPRERAWLTSFGLILLTFKPHIGGLMILGVVVYLLLRGGAFVRRTLWITGGLMSVLFVSGFLVDPAWPVHYLEKLLVFRDVSHCEGVCMNLPMVILSLFNISSIQPVWVGGIMLIGWIGLFIRNRPNVWKDASLLGVVAICIILLSSPYLYNYDFVVLLLPLFMLAAKAHKPLDWFWLAIAYILPWVGITFGRQGNWVLLVSAFALILLVWHKSKGSQGVMVKR